MKEFQVTLYFTLCLLSWANAVEESSTGFIFRCVDKQCSEPILTVRVRFPYRPDHHLKMHLSPDASVSIHGVSNLTELVLVNSTAENPKLVSPKHLYYDRKRLNAALQRANKSVHLNLPSKFAKTKNGPVKEEHNSTATREPRSNVCHRGVMSRFLEVVLNMSFFEGEGIIYFAEKKTVPHEEKDGEDAAVEFFEDLTGNKKTNSAGTDGTINSNDGIRRSGLQSSEHENTKKEDSAEDDSVRKPNIVDDGTFENVDQNISGTFENSSIDGGDLNATQVQNSSNVHTDNGTMNATNLPAHDEPVIEPNASEQVEDPSASTASIHPHYPNEIKHSEPTPSLQVPNGAEQFRSQPQPSPSGAHENEQINDTSTSDNFTVNNETSMAPEHNATDESHTFENKTTDSIKTEPLKEEIPMEEQRLTEETTDLGNFTNPTTPPAEVPPSTTSDIGDSGAGAEVTKTLQLEQGTFPAKKLLPSPLLNQFRPSGVDHKDLGDVEGTPSDATTPKPESEATPQLSSPSFDGSVHHGDVISDQFPIPTPPNYSNPYPSLPVVEASTEAVTEGDQPVTTPKPESEATPQLSSPPLDGNVHHGDVISDQFPIQTPPHYSNPYPSPPAVETSTEAGTEGDQPVEGGITDEPAVDEKSFYVMALEYVSTFTVSIPNFSDWFSQSESENAFCDQEDCDGVVVIPMTGVDLGLGGRPIRIPLWGELTAVEREKISTYAIVFLLTVFLVICSTFSVFNREWKKKEKKLVAFVNRLEGKLLVSTREISSLEERVCNVKTRTMDSTMNADKKEAIKEAFNKQLKHYQDKNSELEDKVTYLEKELESVQHYALEMHKLFENSLTTQSTSRAAIDEVDELRMLTERQENEIDDLRRQMDTIVIENQILKEASENAKSLSKKLEQDYNVQMKKNLELSEKQKELTFRLEKEIDNSLSLENDYKSQIYQLHSKLEEVEMKLKSSEFQVEEMSRVITQKKDAGDWETSSDDGMLKIQVSTLEAMNLDLTNQLKDEKGARRMVEDHMGTIIKDLNALKKMFEVSEKERNEAVTKLQVLTDYFNNEKTKIHKELEAKEKLLTENESKDQLLSRTMQSLKEEINNYKLQNEALKKEIGEQEVSFKIQLAKAEQKGRDDWFALRKTERKYKECQQEAAGLRNRILILESNTDQKEDEKNMNGMNGDLSAPPPPLTYPIYSPEILPLPSDFMPTPPTPPLPSHSVEFDPPMPPLYSSDERLPPLGGRRVPSPSNSNCDDDDDEFTPPPPLPYPNHPNRSRNEMSSSYTRTTPHSGRQRSSQFRPPRRQRNSVDSPSSGMSVESLDKSTR